MVLLLTVAAVVFMAGIQNLYLIGFAVLMVYLYPIQCVIFIVVLGLLRWQGMAFKQKAINYWNKRKPK